MDTAPDIALPLPQGRYIVPALAQGLAVLSLFTRDRTTLTATEIGAAVGVSRTSIFRILQTLVAMRFVEKLDERRFRLGPALLTRGFAYLASLDLVQVARVPLEQLRDATGNATQLAVMDGTDILYLARCAARSPLTSNIEVGTRLPAHATAMGRIMLMERPRDDIRALFEHAPLPGFTAITPTSMDALFERLAADRARGYVLSHSDFEPGVDSLALPVRDSTGGIVAAISLVGHDWDAGDKAWLDRLMAHAQATSAQISQWLGWQDSEQPHTAALTAAYADGETS
jgi:DNA-binding IclR family transcriptional regulator